MCNRSCFAYVDTCEILSIFGKNREVDFNANEGALLRGGGKEVGIGRNKILDRMDRGSMLFLFSQ